MKRKFGVVAYVMTTLRTASSFEGLRCTVSTTGSGDESNQWTGEAVCVLVGNGRKFPNDGGTQADMTDGLFDVTIVEDVPAIDLFENAVVQRFLESNASYTTRLQLSNLEIRPLEPDPVGFSLDGEMIHANTLSLDVEPRAVRLVGGVGFDPAG
jgi:diacylglycerol kinase family enzyme